VAVLGDEIEHSATPSAQGPSAPLTCRIAESPPAPLEPSRLKIRNSDSGLVAWRFMTASAGGV
jgi:hypothetical protein